MKQALAQLGKEKINVNYYTKEYPVEVFILKYNKNSEDEENELYVPNYQRDFVWSEKRQSKFVESVLVCLPISYIFVADNEGQMEIKETIFLLTIT